MRRVSVFAPLVLSVRWQSSSPREVNHYQRLGLVPGSSLTDVDIKAAYRRKVLACHPDIVPDEEKHAAEAEFRRVSESYAVLMDPTRRATIDAAAAAASNDKRQADTRASTRESTQRPRAKRKDSRSAPFLRRDADKMFADAFNGKRVEDILFKEQFRSRHHQPAATKGEADAGATPHSEVLDRVIRQAATAFAAKVSKEYGAKVALNAKLHVYQPTPEVPKGSHIPFLMFHGLRAPAGVTTVEAPTMGPLCDTLTEPLESFVDAKGTPRDPAPTKDEVGLWDPNRRQDTLKRFQSEATMKYNEGQWYSYHRPY